MKNKPQSHRNSNTHKFKGFQEKLKSIRINSKKFILKKLESDNDNETFLWQTIKNLKEENLTTGFGEFQGAIGRDIQTVAQLLLNEGHVSETFKIFLEQADTLCLQPILVSLVGFARDIEVLFYEKYFYNFVEQLLSIISTNIRCHETIENIFVCFVSLFTLLQKHMKDDFYVLYVKHNFGSLFSKRYPSYINELAAQSLGHLLRRAPNRKKLELCLDRVKKNKDEIGGVSQLLFHAMKSEVIRRLHSSSSSSLSTILDILIEENEYEQQAIDTILVSFKHLMYYVTLPSKVSASWKVTWKEDSKLIFPIIFSKLKLVLDSIYSEPQKERGLKYILYIIEKIVEFRNSILITNFDEILSNITDSLKIQNCDEIGTLIANIISKLLSSSHYNGSSSLCDNLIANYFQSKFSPSVIFYFIGQVVTLSNFKDDIFPLYLEYTTSVLILSNEKDIIQEILRSFVSIVYYNVGPVRTMSDLELWSKYLINFTPILEKKESFPIEKTPSKLLESILSEGLASDMSNLEDIILSCICLPHICPIESEEFVPYLFWIMNDAFEKIQKESTPLIPDDSEPPKRKRRKSSTSVVHELTFNIKLESDEMSKKLIFLVSIVVETLHHLIPETEFLTALSGMELLTILKENNHYRDNIHLLKAIDIHLSVLAKEEDNNVLTDDMLIELYPYMAPSLSSHKPLVRVIVSHIFTLFPYKGTMIDFSQRDQVNMFSIMYEVESMSFSPLEFKERIRLLSQLDVDNVNLNRPSLKIFDLAPLLFLIGQLYINFQDLWPPVMNLITKYAYFLPEENFWPVWSSQMKMASQFTIRKLCNKNIRGETSTRFNDSLLSTLHSDIISHPGYTHLNLKPDYMNFRSLLWKTMQQFPDICEKHNKDIVTTFLNFINNELFPVDVNIAPTQDISVFIQEEEEEGDNKKDDEDMEEEKQKGNNGDHLHISSAEEMILDPSQRTRKAPTNALCDHLALLAKFHNPKVIYKSKELETIYYEFLSHPYMKAQKLALDVLMTYNHKYIMPYKETLYNILDDTTFKNEITVFDVEGQREEQSKSLKEEHRNNFMPFLMRILYGKMLYKTGSHTSGKSKIVARRAIVLRFLAGAKESELQTFLDLSFDFMLHHLEGSALEIVKRVQEKTNPKEIVPLKRMLGALGTLEAIFDHIGSLLVDKRSFMLKIIVFTLSTCVTLLEKKSEVCFHFFPMLKSLRQIVMKRLLVFFSRYEDYKWTTCELEAVFNSAIWGSLDRLPYEGIISPPPLLRLFSTWARNASYQILLSMHHPEDQTLTPMPYIIKLINHPKCSSSVINVVYDLIETLMKPPKVLIEDDDDDEKENFVPFELPLVNTLPLMQKAEDLGLKNLTFGETLVLSCMDDIIFNLKNLLLNLSMGQIINKRELKILITIAHWITKKDDAQELIDIILPLLMKKRVTQNEMISLLLDICTNLLGIIENSEKYSRDLLCLLSVINDRNSRKSLCQVIKSAFMNDEKVEIISKWCIDLNSYRKNVVEEIDTETRLNCLKEVNSYLKSTNKLDEKFALFLIHQNFWILNHAEDQSLDNLSVLCLENLINLMVCYHSDSLKLVKKLIDQMLYLLKSALKTKNENSRSLLMRVFCALIHKCKELHPRLKDLYSLANEVDIEVDFYTNMSHLQWSRRARAFLRLASNLNEGKLQLQNETITEFILPMVSSYLFKEEYAKDGNLLTSCVVCIGALARQLPWYSYQHLLKHYLNLLSRELNQLKLAVRVLEAIIDAFHEDLSDLDNEAEMESAENENELKDQTQDETELVGECDKDVGEENLDEEQHKTDAEETSQGRRILKAQKVYQTFTRVIIPQIQKTLAKRTVRDTEHKVNKKKYPENEDIKRIPLALALIKLLKKLPKKLLEQNANSVLMKLISHLKSKSDVIRNEARNMLVKVMEELGGDYLVFLVNDMKSILTLGYQSHIMVYTLHAILTGLGNLLSPSHIESCLTETMEICIEDTFGDKAQEKEVSKITSKVREVKSEKGYSIMKIIAQKTPVDCLNKILIPLQEKLQTHDKNVVDKIALCLRKVCIGLEENDCVSIEHKSIFIYSLLNEKIDDLLKSTTTKGKNKNQMKVKRLDSFLIEPEPRKVGLEPKISKKTTSHVLVEFGLNLLFSLLRSGKFAPDVKEHLSLLDSYVGIMSNCILSEYPEVSIQALHVISYLIKYPLPSLKENISRIWGQMFIILNKFSTFDLTNGKLFKLVQLDFKVMSLIIKSISIFKLDIEHARSLLCYARNNLEGSNHHSSFIILNAIIVQKINVPEIHEIMDSLKEMSIISTNMSMLDQSRRTFLNYILNYPKSNKQILEILLFFVKNLSFEIPTGRFSAALAVLELISKLSSNVLNQRVETMIWSNVAKQLVKEDTKEQRVMLQKIMKAVFIKSCRKNIYIDNCMKLLEDDLMKTKMENAVSIHMAAQSLTAMLDIPVDDHPSSVFGKILPKIISLLHSSWYQNTEDLSSEDENIEINCLDLCLNSVFDLFLKLTDHYMTKINFSNWNKCIGGDEVWNNIQNHLMYPHLKIRLCAVISIGKLFALYPVEKLDTPPIASTPDRVRNLVLNLCMQLNTECSIESPLLKELGLGIVRNLIYIIRQGKKIPVILKDYDSSSVSSKIKKIDSEQNEITEKNYCDQKLSSMKNVKTAEDLYFEGAYHLLHRVGTLAYEELHKKENNSTFRRECFLNLIAALVVVLKEDLEKASFIVSFIVTHITRELSDQRLPEELRTRTKDVSDLLQETLGIERFNEEVVHVQAKMEKRKNYKKAKTREKYITNPELSMHKKEKKHIAKKEAKKRKFVDLKLKPNKKRKLMDMAIVLG